MSSRGYSEERYHQLSSGSYSNGRPGAVPLRSPSQVTPMYLPLYAQVRSLSSPRRPMYDPHRVSRPSTVMRPIEEAEILHLRNLALSNNPLRQRRKRASASWLNPSPGIRGVPTVSDSSYFPLQGAAGITSGPRRPEFQGDRNTSFSSSHGRASVTPDTPVYPSVAGMRSADGVAGFRGPVRRESGTHDAYHSRKRPSDRDDDDDHDKIRRKVSDTSHVGNAGAVAYHYNARPEVGVEHREFSPIIGLKKFNNWIKSVLIGKFAWRPKGSPGANVLDIGCGKGGDLNKWKQARIRLYVGLDIAETSVQQAQARFHKMGFAGFDGFMFAHDCFSKPISDVLPEDLQVPDLYDNVSMQFCMHYAFESASKARMMIENVCRYLRKGGVFIGSIPNAELLLNRLNLLPEDDQELRFGNSCYYVQFAERRHKGIYGHQYRFFLSDAVEDVPEYLVNWDNFVSLAAEYRLRLVYNRPFNEILQEEQNSRDFGPLLGKMGVINDRGESAMDPDQWEAANLYMAFAFEKQ
ncbi:MAG: mRNA cap guanine-N7 methyltransferase [Tremellales sp. Tagirdzhanova-0007]|nr:MAG: mRNA cap guanine-N7 methyltransferase [Tremellales sp. Tagirdzhanova-0007]